MPKVSQIVQKVGSSAKSLTNSVTRSVGGIVNTLVPNNGNFTSLAGGLIPADSRRSLSGLLFGGVATNASSTQSPSVQFGTDENSNNDWRVRVSISPNSKILYWDPDATGNVPGLVSALRQTDGFIFPYVPQVTVTHSANYTTVPLSHSNYAQYFYESSAVASINISGDFTVQNIDEARYFLAGVYFFRACTKMFYGFSPAYQGSPPPIVYLDGYGQHYLPHVPCVVTSFSHTMPSDVDYIEVNTPQSQTVTQTQTASTYYSTPGQTNSMTIDQAAIQTAYNRVPTASTFTITLQPVISRYQAFQFDYKKFARGDLIVGQGNQFPGGFL